MQMNIFGNEHLYRLQMSIYMVYESALVRSVDEQIVFYVSRNILSNYIVRRRLL